jgi:DNA-binding response OmpR family regulator
MGQAAKRVVVIGRTWTLLEGITDLVELAGYSATPAGAWTEVEGQFEDCRPDLAIIDLTDWLDSFDLPDRITEMFPLPDVPILLISFSGDDRIWQLQQRGDHAKTGRVEIYAHSLLGPEALLEKVRLCLGQAS